jgi:hypothetical protein
VGTEARHIDPHSRRFPPVIAALVWLILAAFSGARRQHESNTAEINHQVRNALQLMVDAGYRTEGTSRRSSSLESVTRIDRTLRTPFPPSRP